MVKLQTSGVTHIKIVNKKSTGGTKLFKPMVKAPTGNVFLTLRVAFDELNNGEDFDQPGEDDGPSTVRWAWVQSKRGVLPPRKEAVWFKQK